MSFLLKVTSKYAVTTTSKSIKDDFEKRLLPFTDEANKKTFLQILSESDFTDTGIILYRAVVADKISDLDKKHLGVSWCWMAEYVWPYDGIHDRPTTSVHVLKADAPLDAIDYEATGKHMRGYSDEHEIRLVRGSAIRLIESRNVGDTKSIASKGFDFDGSSALETREKHQERVYAHPYQNYE